MDLEILENVASLCQDCDLNKGRNKPVFAKGNTKAGIMICGMVPADEENKVGIPFVGRAGQLLDKILLASGLTLDDVYITNLVKCYLPAGQPLQQEWIDACFSYIMLQIDLIKPKVMLTLGKDSSISLLGLESKTPLSKVRGAVFDYSRNIKLIPTYHPSFLLRGGGEKHKNYVDVLKDFSTAKEISLDN